MDAEKYTIYAKQQRANGFRLFAENLADIAQIPPGSRVLDIGCGTGDVTKMLTYCTNLGTIIGIDPDAQMIEVAQKTNVDTRTSFQVGSILNPHEIPAGKFHLATACAVMHWIPNQSEALMNISNCLERGGTFLAHLFAGSEAERFLHDMLDNPEWAQYTNKDFHEANKRVRNQSWVLAENPADHYASLLRNAGFEIVKCDFKPAINYFNEEELQGYVQMSLKKAVSGLSEADYSRFTQQAIDRFKSRMTPRCNGKYWEHIIDRIWVNARKL